MITREICIKIMSEDLIRLLISQFDLIVSPNKDLITFKN